MRQIDAIRDVLWDGTTEELQEKLRGSRYWRRRPEYIVHTRTYLRTTCGLRLRTLLEAMPEPIAKRDFFAQNTGVKGIRYKEASHFLRNIGFTGYAILDKHILSSLKEFGVLRSARPPKNRAQYHRIERRAKAFAETVRIGLDDMDLLLWSRKTGKILK